MRRTPNVAARVQAAAEARSVLVTGNVQRQVRALRRRGRRTSQRASLNLIALSSRTRQRRRRRGDMRVLTFFFGRRGGHSDAAAAAGTADPRRRGPSCPLVGEPGLGKSSSSRSFTPGSVRRRILGLEWNSSSFCRIRRYIQSRSGAGLLRRPGRRSRRGRLHRPRNDARPGRHKAGRPRNGDVLAPLLDIPLPRNARPKFVPEELRRRQLARWSPCFWPGLGPSLLCSRSRPSLGRSDVA